MNRSNANASSSSTFVSSTQLAEFYREQKEKNILFEVRFEGMERSFHFIEVRSLNIYFCSIFNHYFVFTYEALQTLVQNMKKPMSRQRIVLQHSQQSEDAVTLLQFQKDLDDANV